MLSPPVPDLVARDTVLPGLATVLDPAAFLGALREFLPEAAAAHVTHVRYKPRECCVVAYRVDAPSAALEVYAKADPAGDRNGAPSNGRSNGNGPLFESPIFLAGGTVSVRCYPKDHKLRALRLVEDHRARRGLLRELLPDRPDLWDSALERLRYTPERRFAGRLVRDGIPRAVLKVYPDRYYPAASASVFRSRAALRVARCLSQSDAHCILMYEWLPGRLLSLAVSDRRFDLNQLTVVGAALAKLHAQEPPGLPHVTREVEIARLLEVADDLSFLCPGLAPRLERLMGRLAAGLAAAPPVSRPVHGDFHAGQVMLVDGDVAILDFDMAERGDPAADLGMFIAHLQCKEQLGTLPGSGAAESAAAFLDGHRSVTRAPLPAHLSFYIAAGLLRLALHPIRYGKPDAHAQAELILERAAATLDGFALARWGANALNGASRRIPSRPSKAMRRPPGRPR